MRKTLLGAIASAFLLSSCTSTGQFDPTKLAAFIQAVQQNVATACSVAGNIVPTAEAILAMINAQAGATAAAIASSIIAVACPPGHTATATTGTPHTVKVNGVDVDFIKFKQ